jgi:hypothetical protein
LIYLEKISEIVEERLNGWWIKLDPKRLIALVNIRQSGLIFKIKECRLILIEIKRELIQGITLLQG